MSCYKIILLFSCYGIVVNCLQFLQEPKFRSDYQYVGKLDGWMKLHHTPSTFHDAQERCRLEGTTLASPVNEEMISVMRDLVDSKLVSSCPIFTGIHATFSRGDFYTIAGIPLHNLSVSLNMNKEVCVEDPDYDCLALEGMGLSRKRCDDVLPYICFREHNDMPVLGNCTTVDPAYILNETLNTCYKFHPEPKIWSEAFKTCAAEGGYLAIINNFEEAEFLKDLFEKYPPSELTSEFKDSVFMGYHVWGKASSNHPTVYMNTIHGQTLSQAGYSSWAPGQPNSSGECGGMFRTGLLNDVWCHVAYPFICEKDPHSY